MTADTRIKADMDAKDAINLYKSRDVSEKVFRADKSYLGNHCLRVASEEAAWEQAI